MTYATQQAMIERFAEREVIALTDRDSTGSINDAVLAVALANADAEINTYLESRVSLPLAVTPVVLVGYACDIARYRLTGAEVVETETIARRYHEAIKFLTMFAAGKISLGLDLSNAPAPVSPGGGVKFTNAGSIFSRANTVNS